MAEMLIVVNGRLKVLEETIGSYIETSSIQVGNTQDTIDCGGFSNVWIFIKDLESNSRNYTQVMG